jgi:hypothetical protein
MGRHEQQTLAVLQALKKEALTAADAWRELSCMRLAARIYDLRSAGHIIADYWIEVPRIDGSIAHVKKYYLVQEAR